MRPRELESLLKEHGGDASSVSDEDDLGQRRTQLLLPVLDACIAAWRSRRPRLAVLAQHLANGSRDKAWRLPIGDSGILDFFFNVLKSDNLIPMLLVHSLRLVGNCCADTEENRARALEEGRLGSLIRFVSQLNYASLTVSVLHNILLDYEPAQLMASQNGLSRALFGLISSADMYNFKSYLFSICDILVLLSKQAGEAEIADPNMVAKLLEASCSIPPREVGHFISLVSAAISYLNNDEYQCCLSDNTEILFFLDSVRLAFIENWAAVSEEDLEQLRSLQSLLIETLMSFPWEDLHESDPASSLIVETFLCWLEDTDSIHLRIAACLALGNISHQDETCVDLIEGNCIHSTLIYILTSPGATVELHHAVLRFLRNLAIPPQTKHRLGRCLEPPIIAPFLAENAPPPIQLAATCLIRTLLSHCLSNVFQATKLPPPDRSDNRSLFQIIVSFIHNTQNEQARLEAARSIFMILRVLYMNQHAWQQKHQPPEDLFDARDPETASNTDSGSGSVQTIVLSIFGTDAALSSLFTRPSWPQLKSEAWFVFALMSRFADGASLVNSILDEDAAVDALKEVIYGDESEAAQLAAGCPPDEEVPPPPPPPPPPAKDADVGVVPHPLKPPRDDIVKTVMDRARADRENAIALCSELVKNCEQMTSTRQQLLTKLVQDGAKIVEATRSAEAAPSDETARLAHDKLSPTCE